MAAYFQISKRKGRITLVDSEGEPFFSLGLNHFDSGALRHPENLSIWRERYGNLQQRWIREGIVPDLRHWNFNTVGFTYEVALRRSDAIRHTRRWTADEYLALEMPYCACLDFLNLNWQAVESRTLDLRSPSFPEWCDYEAREVCARLADDPNLIGYFYADCPTWTFARIERLKPAFFDPRLLETRAGRRELRELATIFYRTAHEAIRRYDSNHLILGDRYEGRHHLAAEVLESALPYVDVLSFQHFGPVEQVTSDFQRWHAQTGHPILLADATAFERQPARYGPALEQLMELPFVVGWHTCGAYLTNRVRGHGFKTEKDEPIPEVIEPYRRANAEATERYRSQFDAKSGLPSAN